MHCPNLERSDDTALPLLICHFKSIDELHMGLAVKQGIDLGIGGCFEKQERILWADGIDIIFENSAVSSNGAKYSLLLFPEAG